MPEENNDQKLVQLEEQNKKLIAEGLRLQQDKNKLQSSLHKGKLTRIIAIGFVFVFFSGLILHLSHNKSVEKLFHNFEKGSRNNTKSGISTFVVEAVPVSQSIPLAGTIQPLKEIYINCPFQSTIIEKNFFYGQQVTKGTPLITIDKTAIQVKRNNAEIDFIKAQDQYNKITNWESSNEVAEAKRTILKTKQNLALEKKKLQESEMLFKNGVISADDFNTSKEQFEDQQLSLKSGQAHLETVLIMGSDKNLQIAKMQMENAKTNLDILNAKIEDHIVKASLDGVIIRPPEKNNQKTSLIEVGSTIEEGQPIAAISNLDGYSVHTTIDEMSVGKIKLGQKATITGDGFPGESLEGEITHISSQAQSSDDMGSSLPSFKVIVSATQLTPAQRTKVRLGMSANLEVVIYSDPQALLVPIDAVHSNGQDQVVTLQDKSTGKNKDVVVETGVTTLDSVEIKKGLKAGNTVVIQALVSNN